MRAPAASGRLIVGSVSAAGMSEAESIHRWFEYNAAVRQDYLATLAKLPPGELTRDRGASFPTFIDILTHTLGGASMWVGRLSALFGEPYTRYEGPDDMTLADVRNFDRVVRGQVDRLFARITDTDLDREYLVPKMPPWWDEDFTTSVRSTLLHLIEHELQHRGEMNALLWQIDVDPPIMDWGDFEKAHPRAARR